MKVFNFCLLLVLILSVSCEEESNAPRVPASSVGSGGWSIPSDKIFDGGPGKDGIPALENPPMISADEATTLADDDLVVGVVFDGQARAYSHQVLDWHEIINDQIGAYPFAITYCPLTGTAINWSRNIGGETTTFGVSGLLYNSNLIPYDRKTDSNWSQMLSQSVFGGLIGSTAMLLPVLETTWGTWKLMYPNTQVISTDTGIDKPYGSYPYITSSGFDYREESFLIFPVNYEDDRLDTKERVLGVSLNGEVKVFRFQDFEGGIVLRTDSLSVREIVIIGSMTHNFLVAFKASLDDATRLDFTPLETKDLPNIMTDQLGNTWNIFGQAVAGPNTGEQLTRYNSYIGYWFAWVAFHPDLEIAAF